MIKWFDKLNIYYKCSVLSAIFLFLALALLPLFHFNNMNEYPLGLILGVSMGELIFILNGYLENKYPDTYKWAVAFNVFRYLLFAILLIVLALCYYKWEIKVFNLFTYVSGYTLVYLIFIILYAYEGRKEGED